MAPPSKKLRGPTAYFIFTEEKRPEVLKRLQEESENGKVAAPATAKALGELWASMSEEEKEVYKQKAKERAEAAAAAAAAAYDADGEQGQGAAPATDAPTQAAPAMPKHIVKRIMLTDDEVQRVSADALWLVSEAARLFLHQLAVKGAAAAGAKKRKTIKLEDFEHVVRTDKRLVIAGLKDIVNNKRLYEQANGSGSNASRKLSGKAAAAAVPKAGSGSSPNQGNKQQQAGVEQQADDNADNATAAAAEEVVDEQHQQQDDMTDEQCIALEEEKRKKDAEAAKARAAKAAERKKAKADELAKSTHKITTFFVSNKPDTFV